FHAVPCRSSKAVCSTDEQTDAPAFAIPLRTSKSWRPSVAGSIDGCFSVNHGPARMRTVDETKPYIWIEPTRPPADSSREFGDTAAIHLVVPNVSRVDVPMTRTERNAVAFDYFCKKFKDGINV